MNREQQKKAHNINLTGSPFAAFAVLTRESFCLFVFLFVIFVILIITITIIIIIILIIMIIIIVMIMITIITIIGNNSRMAVTSNVSLPLNWNEFL